MLEKEIENLKEYLEKDTQMLESELMKIEDQIEVETTEFFSRYENKEIDESVKDEFRNSLRNIYNEKFAKKRDVLSSIASKVSALEKEYC